MKMLSVVVPMYNEGHAAPLFFDAVIPMLENTCKEYGMSWEIVAVNDGSKDNTEQLLFKYAQAEPRLRVISLSRNFGKEAALTAGLEHACGDAVIPIDADLQDPPDIIPQMLKAWVDGAEMVIAVRENRDSDTQMKRLTSDWFYKLFNALCKPNIPENAGDFRLMDRTVLNALLRLPETNRFMKGLFAWVGFRTATVSYTRPLRSTGESKWDYLKLLNFAMDGITSFSTVPLRILFWTGLTIALLSFIYTIWIIFKTLIFGEIVHGYPTLIVIITFLGGIQIMGLGIIGEYLGRLYGEAKRRPIYITRSTMNLSAQPAEDAQVIGERIINPAKEPAKKPPAKRKTAPKTGKAAPDKNT